MDKENTLRWLDDHDISYQVYHHQPIFTVEQSKDIDDSIPWSHTKNLFIKTKKWDYHMISILSDKRLDSKIFKSSTGIKDFSFATADQLYDQIGIYPWSVGIFGLINNPSIKLYIDNQIRESTHAWRHPNDNSATVVLSHDMLVKYLHTIGVSYDIISL